MVNVESIDRRHVMPHEPRSERDGYELDSRITGDATMQRKKRLTVKESDGSIKVSKEDELGIRLHSRE